MFPRKLSEVFPDEELARVVESELEREGVTLTEGINSLIEIEDLQKIKYLFLGQPLSSLSTISLDERTDQFETLANETTEEEVYEDFLQEIRETTYIPSSRISNFEGLQYLTRLRKFESYYHDFYDFSYLQVLDEEIPSLDIVVTDSATESKVVKNLSVLESEKLKKCQLNFGTSGKAGDTSLVTIASNEQIEIRGRSSDITIRSVNITHFRHFRLANDILTQTLKYYECAIVDLRAWQLRETVFTRLHREAKTGVKIRLPFLNFVAGGNRKVPILTRTTSANYVWDSKENEITLFQVGNYSVDFESTSYGQVVNITVWFKVVEA